MKTPPLPLAEAQARLLALAPRHGVEWRDVAQSCGYFLAQPVIAGRDQPGAALSAMDGFAVCAGDAPGPWRLVGESAAGRPFAGMLGPHEAARISTGALLPQGADTVLIKEDSALDGADLRIAGEASLVPGRHVRPRAMDFARGETVLPAGARIDAAAIGLALAAGHATLPVHRALSMAVIDSGDELVAPAHALAPHQTPASNAAMVAALTVGLPVTPGLYGPVPDRLDALIASLEAARHADVVVTTGGASVGDHDLIRPALAAMGITVDFWRVAIKPGKPLLVARDGDRMILGLPGNPASAWVTAWLFLLPLLRHMLGAARPIPAPALLPLAEAMPAGGGRTEFLRARWTGSAVVLDRQQDSGALSSLARANALVVREARAEAVPAGTLVPVYITNID